jgi:hypothetical protein
MQFTSLALTLDSQNLAVIAGVGVGMMVMVFFGVRFWIVSTRPPKLQDIHTPNVDRLNRKALERMAGETLEEDEAETRALEDEEPPEDLKAIVAPEELPIKASAKK